MCMSVTEERLPKAHYFCSSHDTLAACIIRSCDHSLDKAANVY